MTFYIHLDNVIYLLFVAIKVYKSDNKIKYFKDPKYEVNKLKVFINGLLMNILNPKFLKKTMKQWADWFSDFLAEYLVREKQ